MNILPEQFFVSADLNSAFFQLGTVIIIATVFAFLAGKLKQPLIPAYILTGLLLGPIYHLITNKELILSLSEIGIAFLLFIVGLEMDLKKLKSIAAVAGLGATIRSLLMFTLGFIIALFMGFMTKEAIYFGIIIAFSSTMIVVKLISDKKELDTLHGRIMVGILVMEDILAILALSLMTSLDSRSVIAFIMPVIKGLLLFGAALLLTRYVFNPVIKASAKSQELLFLTSVSACFLMSILAYFLNFSIAIGAFLAGLSLAYLPYNFATIGKVSSLRDFFATLFFVSLGMQLVVTNIKELIVPLAILLVLVVAIKPFITMFICSFFGYKKRVSFMTSISLAQISEFALILVSQGLILGHISQTLFTLTVLVTIVTMLLTSYFIQFDYSLYTRLQNLLKPFEFFSGKGKDIEYMPKKTRIDAIICGQDRIGYSITRTLAKLKKRTLVIDYNPGIIKELAEKKVSCIYGDVADDEVMERLPLKDIKLLVSTIPSSMVNLLIIRKVKDVNNKALIFTTATSIEKALMLYDAGADYVILPHFLGGEHVSLLIQRFSSNEDKVIKTKLEHINELKLRQSIGHEHPRHEGQDGV